MKVLRKNPEWVKQAHDLGLEVNVWTVDSEEDMKYFIGLGVDYHHHRLPRAAASPAEITTGRFVRQPLKICIKSSY